MSPVLQAFYQHMFLLRMIHLLASLLFRLLILLGPHLHLRPTLEAKPSLASADTNLEKVDLLQPVRTLALTLDPDLDLVIIPNTHHTRTHSILYPLLLSPHHKLHPLRLRRVQTHLPRFPHLVVTQVHPLLDHGLVLTPENHENREVDHLRIHQVVLMSTSILIYLRK